MTVKTPSNFSSISKCWVVSTWSVLNNSMRSKLTNMSIIQYMIYYVIKCNLVEFIQKTTFIKIFYFPINLFTYLSFSFSQDFLISSFSINKFSNCAKSYMIQNYKNKMKTESSKFSQSTTQLNFNESTVEIKKPFRRKPLNNNMSGMMEKRGKHYESTTTLMRESQTKYKFQKPTISIDVNPQSSLTTQKSSNKQKQQKYDPIKTPEANPSRITFFSSKSYSNIVTQNNNIIHRSRQRRTLAEQREKSIGQISQKKNTFSYYRPNNETSKEKNTDKCQQCDNNRRLRQLYQSKSEKSDHELELKNKKIEQLDDKINLLSFQNKDLRTNVYEQGIQMARIQKSFNLQKELFEMKHEELSKQVHSLLEKVKYSEIENSVLKKYKQSQNKSVYKMNKLSSENQVLKNRVKRYQSNLYRHHESSSNLFRPSYKRQGNILNELQDLNNILDDDEKFSLNLSEIDIESVV